jgi:ABC-2 type transport system ATP-binding protein
MGEFAIVMENVVKEFENVVAVNNVNLKVAKGELFGLLGPNGASKTTTVNILCGLLKPTRGSAFVGGYDVQRETAEIKRSIPHLFLSVALSRAYGFPKSSTFSTPVK